MGHEISYLTFNCTRATKKLILQECSREAIYNGDYHTGISHIDYYDNRVFETEEEAHDWMESKANDLYNNMAVKVKIHKKPNPEALKKYHELERKTNEAREVYNRLDDKPHFASMSAKFISCPKCNSKINRESLISLHKYRSNLCPVCNQDMRPKTVLDKVEKLHDKVTKCDLAAKEEYKKQLMKTPTDEYWLVRIEYHV